MQPVLHPLASHDLPYFITAPGETDRMMVMTGIFLLVIIVSVGVIYFSLHSLPERMSHRTNQAQAGVVAVLCLVALFTHQHLFWIIAMLLAFIRIPDFETPIQSISDSLKQLVQGPGPQMVAVGESAPPPSAEISTPPEASGTTAGDPATDLEKREG